MDEPVGIFEEGRLRRLFYKGCGIYIIRVLLKSSYIIS
jgi:hypothetical protein